MFVKIDSGALKTPVPKFVFGNCWLCGGAIRASLQGLPANDYDIFAFTKADLDQFIIDNNLECKKIYDSNNLKTFIQDGKKIQLIYRDYKDLKEILDSFDFTICQFAWNGAELVVNPDGLIHLFNKKLVANGSNLEYIAATLQRAFKYNSYGFTPCFGTIKILIDAIRSAEQNQIDQQISYYPNGELRILTLD